MSNPTAITATVKWFDTKKGFGFIAGPDGDVLVHYRSLLQEGFKNLREGDQVNTDRLKLRQACRPPMYLSCNNTG